MRSEACACGATLRLCDDPDHWPAPMLEHVRTVQHKTWAAMVEHPELLIPSAPSSVTPIPPRLPSMSEDEASRLAAELLPSLAGRSSASTSTKRSRRAA